MADVQTISLVITAISVVIGVITWTIQNWNANKTRQAGLFMQLYDHAMDDEFWKKLNEVVWYHEWKDYDDWMKKYGPENPQAYATWFSIGTYLEGVGLLVKRKLIDVSLVSDLMLGIITEYWRKYEPLIKELRIRQKYPYYFEWVEYLYNKVKKKSKHQFNTTNK